MQRRAMQSSDEVSVPRKASLIDGASDSEEEEQAPLKQSEREDDAQEADEVSSLMTPSSVVPWHFRTLVCPRETQDCLNRQSPCAQCGFLHAIMSLLGRELCYKSARYVASRCKPLHCSLLPIPVGCASFAQVNSVFVCSRVKLHLRAVCCQQRARASRRLLASKAASPGLLLTLLQQETMTRRMCCKTTNSLMTVIWRTDRAVFSALNRISVQCCCCNACVIVWGPLFVK